VLTLAALQGTALAGGVMLLIYAAGMVVPLLVLALVWDISDRTRRLARPRRLSLGRWSNSWTNIIGGILTVVLGIFLLLTHAATSLTGGVGVNQTFALEGWIVDNKVGGVANLAIAAAALALLAALFTIRHRRRRRAERPSRDCDRTRQSTS
jgi:thiol:disulfide interchange protein